MADSCILMSAEVAAPIVEDEVYAGNDGIAAKFHTISNVIQWWTMAHFTLYIQPYRVHIMSFQIFYYLIILTCL